MRPYSDQQSFHYPGYKTIFAVVMLCIIVISLSYILEPPQKTVLARPLFAAKPTVSVSIPGEVMVGESFTFDVTLGPDATTTGYGPIIDVVFPVVGAGGNPATPNGYDFVSAAYSGSAIECAAVEFELKSGTIQASHPYARDANGDKLVITHTTAGDKLVSCKLPFGSFVSSQPNAVVEFTAKQLGPPDPAVGTALPIYARGGFMFGEDPLDNWCCDLVEPTLTHGNNVPGWASGSVTPVVIRTNKMMLPSQGSEYETSTGPNFVSQYTITVDIADGKTVSSLQITDNLDERVQFVSVVSVNPSGSCGTTPSTATPGGTLVCDLGSVTGGSGTNDASVTFSFNILDKDGATPPNDILTPNVGGCNGLIPNSISVSGTAGGGTQIVNDTDTSDHEFYACAIASQKDKDIVNDLGPTGASPGDTIEYTLNFQISDYFAVQDIILKDVFSDGQLWDASFTPTMTITEHGNSSSGTMAVSSYSITRDTGTPGTSTGETTVIFDINNELTARSLDIKVLGGCVPAAGGAYNCTLPNNLGATKGAIKFRTIVQEEFTDAHLLPGNSGDKSVDQGDVLKNEVGTKATVLDNTTLIPTTNTTADAKGVSSVEVTLQRGTASKDFYALNGNLSISPPLHVSAGDKITYRIKYDLATSDFEDLYFTDYLPLPVLDVDDPKADGSAANWPAKVTNTCAVGTVPAAGDICFSPADTFYSYSNVQPTVSIVSAGNTLKIEYGDFDDPRNQATVIELLFTIAVNTEPFTDGLKLTNQATVHEGSTQNNTSDSSAIIDFILDEPVLVGKKSVIATSNSNATMDPALSAYTVKAPGSAGVRITTNAGGTITSTYLKNNAINSNINGSDGGDIVSFAIVIENQTQAVGGKGGAYDLTIKDILPALLKYPDVSAGDPLWKNINLAIYYGDGSGPISYTKPDGSAATPEDLFGADGIRLVDPAAGGGVCQSHLVGPGKNIIIVTYDLQIKSTVSPGDEITNGGTITNYSNKEGGTDFTGPDKNGKEGDLVDKSKIKISDPAIAKSIASTTIAATVDGEHRANIEDLTIGEEVTFELVVTIPEGNSTGVTITDNLPTSPDGILSVQSSCVKSFGTGAGSNLTSTVFTPSTATLCPNSYGTHNNTDTDAYNDQVVFDFGDITNTSDGVENDKDKIVLQVVAKVEGDTTNQDGAALQNSAVAKTGSNTQTGSVDFDIVVPDLDISKTDGTDYFAPGGTLVYTISYQNNGTGPALGVKITETVPANTTFDLASSTSGWMLAGTTNACPDNAAAGTVCEIDVGQVDSGAAAQTVNFAVEVDNPLAASVTQITNNASIADENNYTSDTVTDIDELANLGKDVLTTNQTFSTGDDVVIGELVTYQVVVYIPPHDAGGSTYSGLMPNLTVTDDLDEGLAFMDCVSVTASSTDLTTDLTGGFSDACAPDTVNHQNGNPAIYPIPQTGTGSNEPVNQGRRIVFDLGNVTNSSSSQQTITLEYRVAVLDNANNVRGVLLNNSAVANWNQGSTTNSLTAIADNVEIQEPEFTLVKGADRQFVYRGEVITFSFEVRHTSRSIDAFEVILTDPIHPALDYIPGSLRVTSGRAADVIDDSDPKLLIVTWNTFPSTDFAFLEFRARLGNIDDDAIGNTGHLEWTSLSGDVSTPQSPFNTLSTERWYDPPSNIDIYGLSATIQLRVLGRTGGLLPDTGFPPRRVTHLDPNVGKKPYQLDEGFRLEIPSLDVFVPVVGIPRKDIGWDLTWLAYQAGYLEGTAFPTWEGNTVITAHAYLANDRPGPFIDLAKLDWGDILIINSGRYDFVYEVRERYLTTPDDYAPLASETDDWLTLITCYQFDEELDAYLWRTVVRAERVGVITK